MDRGQHLNMCCNIISQGSNVQLLKTSYKRPIKNMIFKSHSHVHLNNQNPYVMSKFLKVEQLKGAGQVTSPVYLCTVPRPDHPPAPTEPRPAPRLAVTRTGGHAPSLPLYRVQCTLPCHWLPSHDSYRVRVALGTCHP